ncbi:MAG: hypothetical protein A2142_01125 [candidate division Zixibacteria bacterium RBG_16_48_11]|nr:MAG: hypothetical protein A2142_01125 [candidate division Zixibacteria bacterium RBG_16_48_11]
MGWRQTDAGKIWAEAAARIVHKQSRVPENLPKTNGFRVIDLRGGFKLNHKVSVNLAVKNLTDESFVESYNQVNVDNPVLEPGRNFIFGVTINTD